MGSLSTWFQTIRKAFTPDPTVHLSPQDAFQKIKNVPSLQLLDVRTKEEYQQGRIAGSRLLPLHELENRLRDLDKNRPLIVYCRGGHRSASALRLLQTHGFKNASHIAGGIMAWNRNGLPVETR